MTKRKTKRTFSDATKIETVSRILNGSTKAVEGRRLSVSTGVLHNWVKDKRYQPTAQTVEPLTDLGPLQAKAPVPSGFQCPHCSGALAIAS